MAYHLLERENVSFQASATIQAMLEKHIDPAAAGYDLLTEALDALKVDSSSLIAFEFSNPWGIQADFRQPFSWTVTQGSVWVSAPEDRPLRLDVGDTIILPRGTQSGAYRFLSDLGAYPHPVDTLWKEAGLPFFVPGKRIGRPMVARWGGLGTEMTGVVSVTFGFQGGGFGPLVEVLPELMIVRASDANGRFLQALLHFCFESECEDDGQPGFAALATQAARLLLVHLVRTYVLHSLGSLGSRGGWLAGLTDAKIARALSCIHRDPSQPWTVATLAAAACMSRSAFAERFMERVGQSPARYLRAWRMHLAREALASGQQVGILAEDLGYRSEAAFRAAFQRLSGQQPRQFRRSAAAASS